MDEEYVNCRYCDTKIARNAANCSQCGAPNSPEPLPWINTVVTRLKASVVKKSWADLYASFMPLHFIIALATLIIAFAIRPAVFEVFSANSLMMYFSILGMIVPLSFYPNWYEAKSSERIDTGTVYFIFRIVYWIIIFVTFFHK